MSGRSRIVAIVGAVALVAVALAILPIVGSAEPREITLTARGMTFYVAGTDGENPTIHVTPGERVRLTLVNDDEGMDHDLSIAAWNAEVPVIHGKGKASIVVQVPDRAGAAEYVCTLHRSMMRGTVDIAAGSAKPTHD